MLWAISAGRCQFRGCNQRLYQDILTKRNYNGAYIAHIVADSENGPRGDAARSTLLKDSISNLMLLCDRHHRLVDVDAVEEYPEELLVSMKKEHERRISLTSDIDPEMRSYIVIYRANIGKTSPQIDFNAASRSILPNHYPATENAIYLGLKNSPYRDQDATFWTSEESALTFNFQEQLLPKLRMNELNHVSLFAMAPIPLLVKLGTLFSDKLNITIHQPIRELQSWNLSDEPIDLDFSIHWPKKKAQSIALNLSMSGTIQESRIRAVLGEDCDIANFCINAAHTDFLRSKVQLNQFRIVMRQVLEKISQEYPEAEVLNVFPAMPVATAIELGRVWMQKSHLPLKIYDQNRGQGGFIEAITIKE